MEAQNKYERELMLHAADVEALQAAKEQVSKMVSVRQHLEETTQKAESQLLECKASWEERERMLKVLLYIIIILYIRMFRELKVFFNVHWEICYYDRLLDYRMKFPRVCLAVKI